MLIPCLVVCLSVISDSYGLGSYYGKHQGIRGYNNGGVIRPCKNNQLDCIREFFAKHSNCTPSYGSIPDPLIINHIEFPIPHANLTYIEDNGQYSGLNNAEFKEFYINQATGKIVLQIVFKELSVSVPTSTIRYHLEGREPVELSDYFFLVNRIVSMTLVVPIINNSILFSEGQVYTSLVDNSVYIKHGPGFISKDPVIRFAFYTLLTNIYTSLKEAYVIVGPLVTSLYIQANVCNFNI